ncbi:uncharacterized protein BDCG_17465 [Blastomyces dermatitidis ER-3]|uniref:Uncharacterized protein n=2 Tax=Ajellomyces dermatitidis TaxID=5039 RepID=A0A0J9ERZ5_AJEDA|nr:uncharacterized protein BDCG_17465 [Blastomyces dermatitidis ER-3]KMW68817.1 hypothetical protein BDDG_13049 [Blastomyces dermatitidis ATCC 18188]OAT02254.1 hypothetical protein BDCG_17465 [Blastomyces dermatitidis ER-3]
MLCEFFVYVRDLAHFHCISSRGLEDFLFSFSPSVFESQNPGKDMAVTTKNLTTEMGGMGVWVHAPEDGARSCVSHTLSHTAH